VSGCAYDLKTVETPEGRRVSLSLSVTMGNNQTFSVQGLFDADTAERVGQAMVQGAGWARQPAGGA